MIDDAPPAAPTPLPPTDEAPPAALAPPRMPLPVVTIALIVVNVIAFAISVAAGASPWLPTPQKMIDLGASFAPLTLNDEPWRLVTSMFLHFGVMHIAMNMIGLWSGGRLAEVMYGRAAYLGLYVVAGLAGGLASAAHNAHVAAAGASGAIFGVFGAIGAFLLAHRSHFDADVLRKEARGLGIFLFYNLLYGASQKSIDMTAHLGGLAGGFVVGLAFEWGRAPGRRSLARIALVTVLGLAAVAGGWAKLRGSVEAPPSEALQHAYQEFDRVQAATISTFNDMVGQAKAEKLGDEAFADRLEKELLPPWQALRQQLAAVPTPSGRLRRAHTQMLAYTDARLAAWTALDDLLRGRTDGGARAKELAAAADDAFRKLEVELTMLD